MSNTQTLLERNREFSRVTSVSDLPIMPTMRTVILACIDARVDPAHILNLDLGEVVVIRNNGGRVTSALIEEVAALAFLVAKMDGETPGPFELVLMQHTQCGAERFADPDLQNALRQKLGVDVSQVAISDHEQSLKQDIERLRNAPEIPGYIVASGYIYDVKTGLLQEVVSPASLNA